MPMQASRAFSTNNAAFVLYLPLFALVSCLYC